MRVTLLNAISYDKLSHWHGFQVNTLVVILTIGKYRVFVAEKSAMVIFFNFHFTRKQQKQQKL